MIIMTHRGKRTEHPTIAAASADFSEKRDASGEGASTFPNAELYAADGTTYLGYVSYNGRTWQGRAKDWKPGAPELKD